MIFTNNKRHWFVLNFYFLFLLIFIFNISTLKSHDCISFVQAKNILEGFPDKPITEIDNSLSLEEAYCAQEKLNYLIKKKI